MSCARSETLYHAVAHRLGNWPHSLETGAYKAIGWSMACERKTTLSKKRFTLREPAQGSLGRNSVRPPPTKAVTLLRLISATLYRLRFSGDRNVFRRQRRKPCVIDNRPKQASRPAFALLEELNQTTASPQPVAKKSGAPFAGLVPLLRMLLRRSSNRAKRLADRR